jgi:hypothetical protein
MSKQLQSYNKNIPQFVPPRLLMKAVASNCYAHPADCQLRWITAHPNGEEPGVPLLVHDNGEEYSVVGGAGGKMNQQVFQKPKGDGSGSERKAQMKEKRVAKQKAAREALGADAQDLEDKKKALHAAAKQQSADITQRALAMLGPQFSGDAVKKIEDEARKRALKEKANASEGEQKEFADKAVSEAKNEANEAVKKIVQAALTTSALRALGDDEGTAAQFAVKLSGAQLVARLTHEQIDELTTMSAQHAATKGQYRATQRALLDGNQDALQGIMADVAPLSPEEVKAHNLDQYLKGAEVDANVNLIKGSEDATPINQRRNQANGASDGLNSFASSLTGNAILRPEAVKALGVENAARVAAAYLVHKGVDSKSTAEGLRQRIANGSYADMKATQDDVDEMDALVKNAKDAAADGDGSVTTAQASVLAMQMATKKYVALNGTRGRLRAAPALANFLENPTQRGMSLPAGSTAIAAHAFAKGMGLKEGDYSVEKAAHGAGGGYHVNLDAANIHKLATPHSTAESDRNVQADQLRQEVENNPGTLNVPGFRADRKLQPHQELAVKAITQMKHAVLSYGAGCIDGSTLIHDPKRNETLPVSEWMERGIAPNVWALAEDGKPVIAQASVPFIKAFETMYEVELVSGQIIRVAAGHKFLTQQGWKPLRELVEGNQVAVPFAASERYGFSPEQASDVQASASLLYSQHRVLSPQECDASRHQSSLGNALSVCAANVRRFLQTVRDSLADYHFSARLGDARLRFDSTNAQALAPSQNDVHEYSLRDLHEDDQAYTTRHTHLCQSSCRLPMRHSENQVAPLVLEMALFDSAYETEIHSRHSQVSRVPSNGMQPVNHSNLRLSKVECPAIQTEESSFFSCDNYTLFYSRIQSIKPMYSGLVYDLEVYKHHNYLAHGIWNHNSGKTAVIMAAGADLLNNDKIDMGLITMPAKPIAQQNDFTDPETGEKSEGEISKFLEPDTAKKFVVCSDSAQVAKAIKRIKGGEKLMLMMTPDAMRNNADALKEAGFGGERSAFFADEAHRFAIGQTEGTGSGMAKVAGDFAKSEYASYMSGTLVENNSSELWSALNAIHPGQFGGQKAFTAEWQRLSKGQQGLFASEAMSGMRDRLSGSMFSYHQPVKGANGEALTLESNTVTVKTTPAQKAAIAKINVEYKKRRLSDKPEVSKGASFWRHAATKRVLTDGAAGEDGETVNPKMEALHEILKDEKSRDPKNRIGVYAFNKSTLKAAGAKLGGKSVRITGDEDDKKTAAAVKQVNDRENGLDAAYLSNAANYGLNLQGLSRIVKMHALDTPSMEDQLDHRHFRTGQTRNVRATTILTDHPAEQLAQYRNKKIKAPEVALLARLADASGASHVLAHNMDALKAAAAD